MIVAETSTVCEMNSIHFEHAGVSANKSNHFPVNRSQFFLTLIDSIEDDLFFYIVDTKGRFSYVSSAAEAMLCQSPSRLLNQRFSDLLSEDACNGPFRSTDWDANFRDIPATGEVEMRTAEGGLIRFKCFQRAVFEHGVMIGVSGVMRRIDNAVVPAAPDATEDDLQILARARSLSMVERHVVDLVVDGHMNKKMASLLDVAVRTVESRRSRAMLKLHAKSLSELVQIWIRIRKLDAMRAPANQCQAQR